MPDDFESLLEESFRDPENLRVLEEKATADDGRRESVGEIVKGYPGLQRELDLHGMSGSEAMFELSNFLNRAIDQHIRTVRVITGKGLHSKHMKSVLPELTERRLGELRRARKVLAFRREKSGGAFLVYLVS